MTNIIDRARDLLQDKGLMLPEEVQSLLRDIVALEPVGYTRPENFNFEDGIRWNVYEEPTFQHLPIYTLGAPNDPA